MSEGTAYIFSFPILGGETEAVRVRAAKPSTAELLAVELILQEHCITRVDWKNVTSIVCVGPN
jgi:hypothetical protein